jgi:hypothetical protein
MPNKMNKMEKELANKELANKELANKELVEKYIAQLSPSEKIVYVIAQKQLESSFSIEKSIGFLEYVKSIKG